MIYYQYTPIYRRNFMRLATKAGTVLGALTIFLLGSSPAPMNEEMNEEKETEKNIQIHSSKETFLTAKEKYKGYKSKKEEKDKEVIKNEEIRQEKDKGDIKNEEIQQEKEQPSYTELTVEATAYVSFCDTGCSGITATGYDVRNTITTPEGYGIIAVDPAVIPLGSLVEIEGKKYKALDTGGAIKGNRIDILMGITDTSKAIQFGRQKINIKIYN